MMSVDRLSDCSLTVCDCFLRSTAQTSWDVCTCLTCSRHAMQLLSTDSSENEQQMNQQMYSTHVSGRPCTGCGMISGLSNGQYFRKNLHTQERSNTSDTPSFQPLYHLQYDLLNCATFIRTLLKDKRTCTPYKKRQAKSELQKLCTLALNPD